MSPSVENKTAEIYKNLESTLNSLVKIYRSLLDTVRQEKEALVTCDVHEIEEINKSKESFLLKLRSLETVRINHTAELCRELKIDTTEPRISIIAKELGGDWSERLTKLQGVLELLLKRIMMMNKENEKLAQSALRHVSGALNSVSDSLQASKPTYGQRGEMPHRPEAVGKLVSKDI